MVLSRRELLSYRSSATAAVGGRADPGASISSAAVFRSSRRPTGLSGGGSPGSGDLIGGSLHISHAPAPIAESRVRRRSERRWRVEPTTAAAVVGCQPGLNPPLPVHTRVPEPNHFKKTPWMRGPWRRGANQAVQQPAACSCRSGGRKRRRRREGWQDTNRREACRGPCSCAPAVDRDPDLFGTQHPQ